MESDIQESVEASEQSRVAQRPPRIVLILVLILLAVTAATVYFYVEVRGLERNPDKVNQEKVAALVAKVEKLIDLPQGEVPSTATIVDPAPLAGNPFFAKAKPGDEVLFYPLAGKAFLYDPKANIIVEVASLNIGK